LQGQLDSNGIPVRFPARISSGTAIDPSEASIIVRYARFTGFEAPLDPYADQRLGYYLDNGYPPAAGTAARYGGAFFYSGGGLHPETHTPTIEFDHVVFDHNRADDAGGAVLIAGRQHTRSGLSVTANHCIFYKNVALGKFYTWGGGLAVVDTLPFAVLVNNTVFDSNQALYQGGSNIMFAQTTIKVGVAESTGGENYVTIANTDVSGLRDSAFSSTSVVRFYLTTDLYVDEGIFEPAEERDRTNYQDQKWNLTFDRVNFHDIDQLRNSGGIIEFADDAANGAVWNLKFLGSELKRCVASGYPGTGTVVWVMHANDAEFSQIAVEDNIQRPESFGVLNFNDGTTRSTRVRDSIFARNVAGLGAAISFSLPGGALHVLRSSFIENICRSPWRGNGAAISIVAAPTLLVEESVFLRNAAEMYNIGTPGLGFYIVEGPPVQDYSVRTYTGFTALFNAGEIVWQIDDGPIYGATFYECELARLKSLEVQQRGFPPFWPNRTSACADQTFHESNRLHETAVRLAEGAHTLYVGWLTTKHSTAYPKTRQTFFIDIVGLVSPVFPAFTDGREAVLAPGCKMVEPCSLYVASWSAVPFDGALGSGGAIQTRGVGDIEITGSTFEGNAAARGSSVATKSAASIKIRNTTFHDDDMSNAVFADTQALQYCEAYPCDPGWSCAHYDHSTFCTPCAANEIGTDGLECTACTPGRAPNLDQSACTYCSAGQQSTVGICDTCPAGKVSFGNSDSLGCQSCPDSQEPAARASKCRCKAGYYNVTFGVASCPGDGSASQLTGTDCQPCSACLDCLSAVGDRPVVLVRPGFALGPAAAARYQGIERGQLHDDKVFRHCGRDMCAGESADAAVVSSALTVEMPPAAADGSARAVFEAEFASAVAG
jgi:hypothetical protein